MGSTDRQRWARVPPGLAWKRPGLPTSWVRVLERHPEEIRAEPGYVWLDMPGKVRHVAARELEFREETAVTEREPGTDTSPQNPTPTETPAE